MSVTKPKRKLSVIGLILSILLSVTGLLASIGGFSHVTAEANYKSVSGTITDLDLQVNAGYKQRTKNRCAPIVEFQVNGQTYTSGPDQYATYGKNDKCGFNVGDEITVNYDPADPTKSTVSNSTFDWIMGLAGGAIAIAFGLIIPLRMIRRSRAEARGDFLN